MRWGCSSVAVLTVAARWMLRHPGTSPEPVGIGRSRERHAVARDVAGQVRDIQPNTAIRNIG